MQAGSIKGLRVAIDARMAFHTGIGRYIRSLTRELARREGELALSLLGAPQGHGESWLGDAPVTRVDFDADIYSVKEQWVGSWLCRRLAGETSVFHFPHYNVPWLAPSRTAVTIHDLTHLQFPEFFPRGRVRLAYRVLRHAVRRASRLIAVSAATRSALERLMPEARGKTTVIHHGVDPAFRPVAEAEVEAFRRGQNLNRFVLYVGANKPHKNLAALTEAFRQVRAGSQRTELVMICGSGETPPADEPGVRVLPAASDEELVLWYNAAQAVALPSLNEGFGMPALESMACGTPVVGSDIPALREVIGEAGLLVDVTDTAGLALAIERILGDDDLRAELRDLALARAATFSWTRAADETLQVYRQLAARHPA